MLGLRSFAVWLDDASMEEFSYGIDDGKAKIADPIMVLSVND